ncbi:hypothetical protein [Embleya sp. MST-111070]|uniref:hypothetical protein n=1 Tax=Embleya sp. MST-111070 TaxID=3398231 RepID=UPI003F73A649
MNSNDDHTTTTAAALRPAAHGHPARVPRLLAATAVRGIAGGAGSAIGARLVWWITHH